MKRYTLLRSKAFPLILMYSIVSILGGLVVPLTRGPTPQVSISFGDFHSYVGTDLYVDVNINVTDATIIGYAFDVKVNPAVLEVHYDYGAPYDYDFVTGVGGYFLYDWASTNAPYPHTVVISPDRNVTAGTLIDCQEVVFGWKDFSVVKGASGTGLLAHLFFTPINTTAAYSPIIITNAEYWTYHLADPDNIKETYPIDDAITHYGTPIHEVGVNSVETSASSVNRGSMVTLKAEACNLGGFPETFDVTTYYNKTATEWEPISPSGTFTLDPLETVEKSLGIWDTEEVEPGNYTIKANATVAGDTNGTNNIATTTIEIKPPLYDLAITDISVNSTSPFIGDIVEINVTAAVLNAHLLDGTVDSVNFTVTVKYNNTPIDPTEGKNATLVPEGETRNFTFYWNTAGVPASAPSNYTIEARVSLWVKEGWDDLIDFNDSNSTEVQVRIPGDANSDGIVDIFDIYTISAHWYPGPPAGPLGYAQDVDINHDGNIDIDDIEILSAHWGETA